MVVPCSDQRSVGYNGSRSHSYLDGDRNVSDRWLFDFRCVLLHPLLVHLLGSSTSQANIYLMSKWRNVIEQYYKNLEIYAREGDPPFDPSRIVTGEPASGEAIKNLESELGVVLPEEFHSLYSEFDGFGNLDDDDGEILWGYLPLAQIPTSTEDSRRWFRETHPDIASRYVAFQDFGNGDTSGYVFDESLKNVLGLFTFEHESYEFEESQDWQDFLLEGIHSTLESDLSSE